MQRKQQNVHLQIKGFALQLQISRGATIILKANTIVHIYSLHCTFNSVIACCNQFCAFNLQQPLVNFLHITYLFLATGGCQEVQEVH